MLDDTPAKYETGYIERTGKSLHGVININKYTNMY